MDGSVCEKRLSKSTPSSWEGSWAAVMARCAVESVAAIVTGDQVRLCGTGPRTCAFRLVPAESLPIGASVGVLASLAISLLPSHRLSWLVGQTRSRALHVSHGPDRAGARCDARRCTATSSRRLRLPRRSRSCGSSTSSQCTRRCFPAPRDSQRLQCSPQRVCSRAQARVCSRWTKVEAHAQLHPWYGHPVDLAARSQTVCQGLFDDTAAVQDRVSALTDRVKTAEGAAADLERARAAGVRPIQELEYGGKLLLCYAMVQCACPSTSGTASCKSAMSCP